MYFSTADEMEKLDELAVEHGLEIRQMMELAGWHMVEVFNKLSIGLSDQIVIVVGKGNKGGDGLSAARHLVNHGYKNISIILVSKDIKPDSQHHLDLLVKMDMPIMVYSENQDLAKEKIDSADIIMDSLIGYHLQGEPRGDFAELIEIINNASGKVISYDLPSGVDATTGECQKVCIKADATLTLAMPKKIFNTNSGKESSGQVFALDIGVPEFLYNKIASGSRPESNHSVRKNSANASASFRLMSVYFSTVSSCVSWNQFPHIVSFRSDFIHANFLSFT
ncbi:MAG: NAD(P)H-hydrate epimerase [Candidatus Magasanikbacteria bacterium]|jgi:hydroxyethylthiazole kinase-like uncharacterized protein yjeF|nr:NAD(P)H-hydrate epimerase [Candidatus Magasanikbacteria bacterium]MBT5262478.1 NAD(P)H-hydrate epimerase [Candidatus Magasanikbacteria bacterium]MBT5820473.1 NAD(P)H-hydrate epimerase [Candidatus Magasanikbacteria bacterium]MBT6294423.1 NAD(P)H-hydrate epimerase [Candidatus Magasanikbacteria bacterium]